MIASYVIGVLALLAVGMATTTAIAIKWAVQAKGPLGAGTVEFVLAMMGGMFVGVLVYFGEGGTPGIVAGLWVAAVIMSASVFLVFVGFLREAQAQASGRAALARRGAFLGAVIALVIANEFLMGWSFSLLSGSLPAALGSAPDRAWEVLVGAVTSPWFVFPMALEMLLSLAFFLGRFPNNLRRFLLVQPAIMVCSPPTIAGPAWWIGTSVVASALMAVAVAWLLIALFRGELFAPTATRYLLLLFGSFGLMAAGLFVWIEYGSAGVFALALLAQMLVFLRAVTDPDRFAPDRDAPPARPDVPASAQGDGT